MRGNNVWVSSRLAGGTHRERKQCLRPILRDSSLQLVVQNMLQCQHCTAQLNECSVKVDQMTIRRISCLFVPVSEVTSWAASPPRR